MKKPWKRGGAWALVLALLIGATSHLGAQDGQGRPSTLRVGLMGSQTVLTWEEDAQAAKGYIVYRFATKPEAGNFATGTSVAVLLPGTTEYTDTPPPGTSCFYLVLSRDADGNPIQVFEPSQNMTKVAMVIPGTPAPATAPVAVAQAPAAPAPAKAAPSPTPAPPAPAPTPAPAKAPPSTAPASPPAAPPAKATPTPAAATPPAAPPKPAQVAPAFAPTPAKEAPRPATPPVMGGPSPVSEVAIVQRQSPLPFLPYGEEGGDGAVTKPLSPEAQAALDRLLADSVVESRDLPDLAPLTEDGAAAWVNLRKLLAMRDWKGVQQAAQIALRDYPARRAAAKYYEGLSLANLGDTKGALYAFLAAESGYPAQAKPWVDYLLDSLVAEGRR